LASYDRTRKITDVSEKALRRNGPPEATFNQASSRRDLACAQLPACPNAPIRNAAKTPSSKPKIILRAFGRRTGTRPQSTPAAVRNGCEGRAGIVGTRVAIESQCKCSPVAVHLSTTAGPITDFQNVLHLSHGLADEYYAQRSGNRWVSE
jgi:hypothetical protein